MDNQCVLWEKWRGCRPDLQRPSDALLIIKRCSRIIGRCILHRSYIGEHRSYIGRLRANVWSNIDRWSVVICWTPLNSPMTSDSTDIGRCSAIHRPILERCVNDGLPMRSDVRHRWRHRWILTTNYFLPMTPPIRKKDSVTVRSLVVPGRQPRHFHQKTHRFLIVYPIAGECDWYLRHYSQKLHQFLCWRILLFGFLCIRDKQYF